MNMRFVRVFVWTAFLAAAISLPALKAASQPEVADSASAELPTLQATTAEPAELTIANRPVFVFRSDFLGYPPQKRLEATLDRFKLAMAGGGPGVVTTTETNVGVLVNLDGRLLFTVTAGDVDPFRQVPLEVLVENTRADLEQALAAYHEQRSVNALVSGLLKAILATVIMVRALQYLRRFVRWSTRKLEEFAARRMERVKAAQHTIATQLAALIRLVVRVAGVLLALLLVYSWLVFVLDRFPYTSPWGDQLGSYLGNTVLTIVVAILRSIPGLVMVVIIFFLARMVARWIRLLFTAVRHGRMEMPGVDIDTALPTQRLITIFVWLLAVALAFPFIPGSGGAAFKGISVLFGLMVSLGASSVVGQAASGYILMYSRSMRVGDYVRVGEHEGAIISMSMLSTKIRTPRDEEINVPNSVIVNSITKNYTRLTKDTGAVLPTTITIGYSTPWRQVHAMMAEAAARTPGIRKDAKPVVMQSALSDFYVEYTLLVRLERPNERAIVASALHANIQDAFNEHGVQIMSPHYENDPADKIWVPKEKWFEPPAESDGV